MAKKPANEYDVEQWRHKRLREKLALNLRGAIFALILLLVCEIFFLMGVLFFKIEVSEWRFCTFPLIAVGFLLQRCFAVRYGGTRIKASAWYNRLCSVGPNGFRSIEFHECRGDFFSFKPVLVKNVILQNYPVSRLLLESCVLFAMCAMTEWTFSPYLALFLLHSSLAALVINDRFSLYKFSFGFSILVILLVMYGDFASTALIGFSVFKWVYAFILLASCTLTGSLVRNLMCKVDENDKMKNIIQGKLIKTMLKAWRTNKHLTAFDCKSGNFVISLNGCSSTTLVAASEVIMLIPTCLRKIGCDDLNKENFQSINTDCKRCDVDNCDVGFIVNELGDEVFWRIVGHGHNIKEAFQDFVTEKQRNPSAIFGIACVNSFSELVGEMIGAINRQRDIDWHATIKEFGITRILYAKLVGDCADCPSLLHIPVDEHSRIQTRINRENFIDFLKYTIKFQLQDTSLPNKEVEPKSLF